MGRFKVVSEDACLALLDGWCEGAKRRCLFLGLLGCPEWQHLCRWHRVCRRRRWIVSCRAIRVIEHVTRVTHDGVRSGAPPSAAIAPVLTPSSSSKCPVDKL